MKLEPSKMKIFGKSPAQWAAIGGIVGAAIGLGSDDAFANPEAAADAALNNGRAVPESVVRQEQGQYVHVSGTSEAAIDRWKPGVNLLLAGPLEKMEGLTQHKAQELADWLQKNHPNWVVVLSSNAMGESYTYFDTNKGRNQTVRDNAAVNWRAATDLTAKEGFSEYVDHRIQVNGESAKNGSVLVINFEPRDLFMANGQAFEAMGLSDEAAFKSVAERVTKPILRNGSRGTRIFDAVTQTVSAFESKLTEQVQRRENAARESRQRASQSVKGAERALDQLESQLDGFQKKFPEIRTELAHPDLTDERANVEQAASALAAGDLGRASSLSSTVSREARHHIDLLTNYETAESEINRLADQLDSEQERRLSHKAAEELGTAFELLSKTRNQWEHGDLQYASSLQQLTNAVDQVHDTIGSAQTKDVATKGGAGAAALLLGLVTTGVGWVTRKRQQNARKDAETLLEGKSTDFQDKINRLGELQNRKDLLFGSLIDSKGNKFTGTTKEAAAEAHEIIGNLYALQVGAQEPLKEAKWLLSRKGFAATFKTKYPDEARAILTAEDSKLAEFNETFEKQYSRARAIVNQIATSREEARKTQGRIVQSLEGLSEAVSGLRAGTSSDGRFDVADQVQSFVSRLSKENDEFLMGSYVDPFGAKDTGDQLAGRVAAVDSMVAALRKAREQTFKKIIDGKNALEASGLKPEWIEQGLDDLTLGASEALDTVIAGGQTDFNLGAELSALAARVEQAVQLDERLRDTASPLISGTELQVEQTRTRLGELLGVGPDAILREKGAEPDKRLAFARARFGEARAQINRGGLNEAERSVEASIEKATEAAKIVSSTNDAYQNYPTKLANRDAEQERLRNEMGAHRQILEDIRTTYHDDVLRLGEGDATHPHANGTVDDNIEEANQALEEVVKLKKIAEEAFASGEILKAREALARALKAHEYVEYRYEEIVEKQERLKVTDASNDETLEQLNLWQAKLEQLSKNPRVMQPSVDRFEQLSAALEEAAEPVGQEGRNPFAIAKNFAVVREEFQKLERQINNDIELYQEADRSIVAALQQIERGMVQADKAEKDGYADSWDIKNARQELRAWKNDIEKLGQAFEKEEHADWSKYDEKADRLFAEAQKATAVLKRELKEARETAEAFARAKREVRDAKNWSGSYGVYIAGSYGQSALRHAKELFEKGQYEEAIKASRKATRSAQSAVSDAEAEVSRKRRAEERRQAAEAAARRRRRARQSSSSSWSSSGSSSWGSGGSSSSWSSGGSGGTSAGGW